MSNKEEVLGAVKIESIVDVLLLVIIYIVTAIACLLLVELFFFVVFTSLYGFVFFKYAKRSINSYRMLRDHLLLDEEEIR